MKILSITTSSNVCGVSILDDNFLICKLDSNTGRTHSENLMPMIDEIFNKTNLSLSDIGLIVCDIGPGSFTGIRIGVSTVKAFSDSLSIPCIGISSLEGLAYNVNSDGYICSLLDRKHNNCYFALYELHNGIYKEIVEPQASSIENALSKLSEFNSPITFAGDGAEIFHDQILHICSNALFVPDSSSNILDSYNVGLAGFNKYISDSKIADILPLYLKESDAKQIEY